MRIILVYAEKSEVLVKMKKNRRQGVVKKMNAGEVAVPVHLKAEALRT